eukprot:4040950-Pleurochrysis_carterae.AAC.5
MIAAMRKPCTSRSLQRLGSSRSTVPHHSRHISLKHLLPSDAAELAAHEAYARPQLRCARWPPT